MIGGYVYRGAEYSNMFKTFFFSDQCFANIKTIIKNSSGTFTPGNLGTLGGSNIVSFGEDKWGELYVVTYGGTIYKFRGANCSPVAYITDETIIHECVDGRRILKTPPGNGFTYSWKRNGVVIPGANNHTYPAMLPGDYTVTVTNRSGCTSTSAPVNVVFDLTGANCEVNLNLRLFIDSYYEGNGMMTAAMYNGLVSNDPTDFDSVTVELHEEVAPYNQVHEVKVLMKTDGRATVPLPPFVLNQAFYLVVRHRNSVETWSKNPLFFESNATSFDFTGLD